MLHVVLIDASYFATPVFRVITSILGSFPVTQYVFRSPVVVFSFFLLLSSRIVLLYIDFLSCLLNFCIYSTRDKSLHERPLLPQKCYFSTPTQHLKLCANFVQIIKKKLIAG